MKHEKMSLEIFLIAMAIILIEVCYTRVFSFKLVYYFTYVIIGIALLGLGAGGVMVSLIDRLRQASAATLLPACCLGAGLSVPLGYAIIAYTQLNSVDLVSAIASGDLGGSLLEGSKLVLICLALFAPFLLGGIAIAAIFATQSSRINRLYFADLMGAGLGCALAVPLMTWLSPPGAVILAGACFTAAGLRRALHYRALLVPTLVLTGLLAVAAHPRVPLPDPIVDGIKTMSPDKTPNVFFSRWSPVFRVDVIESLLGADVAHMLSHDGMWGSILPRFDGDFDSLSHYDDNPRAYPFALLPEKPRVAIIGSAGGNEILASLHFDAAHVTGVELNPVTVSLLREHFADYTGNMVRDPRVDLINGEGRSFIMSSERAYDLIWFVAPDSYAAMNAATSGAFVLSESYLYTDSMIVDSLEHLSEGGLVCAQFGELDFDRKPNRTARYLNTARDAFRQLGIDDFERHVLLATTPGFGAKTATILLSRTPFRPHQVEAFLAATQTIQGAEMRYVHGSPDSDPRLRTLIEGSESEVAAWREAYPFEVGTVTDDAPFFWHFVPFRMALGPLGHLGRTGTEEGMGERLLMVLLSVATLLGAVFLLLPLLSKREVWGRIPHKKNAFLYFAALGLGFMFLEVTLIQRLTLFLGYPTYSLSVTLFALLVFTGLGSLVSERAARQRNRALLALGGVLVLLVLFYGLALPPLVRAFIAWSLPMRVVLAVLMLAPLGLLLGVFMPLGLRTLAALTDHPEEYVAWGWAVNGFFSVVSSVLGTMLAMTYGFDAIMLLALVIYGIGIVALYRVPEVDLGV